MCYEIPQVIGVATMNSAKLSATSKYIFLESIHVFDVLI